MTIPKKPLAVSRAKKKLPVELDWGPGIPKDRLAYINADEKALIQRFRKTKAARDYAGIPAFASDSASSKGVERGADGPSGVGRGSSSGGSSTTSKSSSTSASGGSSGSKTGTGGSASPSKSSSSPSAASSGQSKAPNAAAQAASNKLNSTQSRSSSPATNAAASGSISRPSVSASKAPNAAAAYASDKLNATAGALKAAQQPQSIQGMINSGVSNPVSYSGQFDNGYYHSFSKGPLPGQNAPNQFDKTVSRTNMVNANHIHMDQFSNGYNPNQLTAGAQKIHQAIVDNAFRTGTPVDFFSGKAGRDKAGTKQHPAGQAIDVRLKDPVTGSFVGSQTIGPLASNPIGNVKLAAGRTPSVAKSIQGAIEGPYREFAKGVLNSFMDNPGVYGDFNNQRWGGSFGGKWGKDYMHYDEGIASSGVSADQAALRREAANYQGPTSSGTMLAGNTPANLGSTGLAAAAAPQAAPAAPKSYAAMPADPRVSMPPGSLAPPEMGSPPGYMSQFAMNEQDINNLKTQAMKEFSFGDLMNMQKNISALPGFMGPITKDQQRVASMAAQPQAPQQMAATAPPAPSYSQSLPGRIPGYTPTGPAPATKMAAAAPAPSPVYSDNPIQGPSNPMQEGADLEAPEVTRKRADTYGKVGATAGTLLLGGVGGLLLGTLGRQMGSTPQRVRSSIASNPKALNANVQSINQMVEERGGKGNPQMRVTDRGLKDVLTNPSKVTSNPDQYTTLEQMLAALAQGIDPYTGKKVA
jgi:hypothetical protein